VLALAIGGAASAQTPASAITFARPQTADLQLEVWINGASSDQIAAFQLGPDGRLSAMSSELRAVGLHTDVGPERRIRLDDMAGVSYRYDAAAQRVDVQAEDRALIARAISLAPSAAGGAPQATSGTGALVNYSLAAEAAAGGAWGLSTLAGDFEARAFGRYGLVTTTVQSLVTPRSAQATRLDSAWTWSDKHSLITYAAGDVITGGFDWTRPVRLGGVQVRREFALRPDLVTMPSPTLSASAAVPSMAEVIVNGATVMSNPVGQGPLTVGGLPAVQGASVNTLVLRDALGRQTVQTIAFFATPQLLRPGFLDFSAETGFARRYYGVRSMDYDPAPTASGSVRYGLTDWATAQAHAEGGSGLALAGVGGVLRLGGWGAVSGSLAGSRYGGQSGGQASVALQSQWGPVSLGARTQATAGRYQDLGSVTAPSGAWQVTDAFLPPKSLTQINAAVTLPPTLPWIKGWNSGPSVGVSYSAERMVANGQQGVVGVMIRQTLPRGASLFISAYRTDQKQASAGLTIGLAFAFGGGRMADVGADVSGSGSSEYAEVSRDGGQAPGAVSWRLHAEGGQAEDLEAEAAYVAPFARGDLLVQHVEGSTALQGRMDGAVVLMGGQVALSNRIDDAFAVVDAGRPGVPVLLENRVIGQTGADGRLVAPYLASLAPNTLSIDAEALPGDLIAPVSQVSATPDRDAGVLVRFTTRKAAVGVLIVLKTPSGSPLPVGATGRFGSGQRPFVVGYDGEAYVEDASSGLAMTLTTPDGAVCTATLEGSGQDIHASSCR
jgi:outer membrane usher protein